MVHRENADITILKSNLIQIFLHTLLEINRLIIHFPKNLLQNVYDFIAPLKQFSQLYDQATNAICRTKNDSNT